MVNLAKCYITLSLWGDILILPRGGNLKMEWPVLPPQIFKVRWKYGMLKNMYRMVSYDHFPFQ